MFATRFLSPRRAATLLLAALACGVQAAPVTIGFEGQVANTAAASVPSPYVESGYALAYTGSASSAQIFGAGYMVPPGSVNFYNGHGSAVFGFCGTDNSACAVNVLTLTHATPFSLLGLDLANLYLESSRSDRKVPRYLGETLDLVGTFVDGSTIELSLDVSPIWTTFNIAGFTNLSSVTLTANATSFVAIDNLRVNATGHTRWHGARADDAGPGQHGTGCTGRHTAPACQPAPLTLRLSRPRNSRSSRRRRLA